MRDMIRLLALLLLVLGATPGPGRAQEITGAITSATDGAPVAGAIVILMDASGARVAGTLSENTGRYRLRVPAPGTFSLRVDVIGFRSVIVPPFPVTADAAVTRDIRFTFARTQLPAVAVTATSACARVADETGDAPRLWSEVRKTLEASRIAIEERRFTVALRRYERTIGLPDSVLRGSRTWTQTAVSENPFETLTPDAVARGGFAVDSDSARLYYAPDARILLADSFVASHCFGTRRGGPGGAIGLTFRPQQTGKRIDISGVLWLDSATAELRSLEYKYLPAVGRQDVGGGTVAFGRYPTGVWGVQRWMIRLPVLRVFESRFRPDGSLGAFVDTMVVALRDVGGEVIAAGTAAASANMGGTRLRGTVFDSSQAAPLRGAMVTIEGLGRTVETDLEGRFLFDSLSDEGEVRVRVWHPRLDSLGLPAPVTRVALRRRNETVADFATGSVRDVARQRCRRDLRAAERIIVGTYRSATDSAQGSTEVVLLERVTTSTGRDSLVRHTTFTSDAGRYAFCQTQAGTQSWIIARDSAGWLNPRHVNGADAPPVEVVPLRVPSPDTTRAAGTDVTGAPAVILGRTLQPGPAAISGWVLLPEQNDARVQILVDDVQRGMAAADGSFNLPNVPVGTRRLTFRAPGLAQRHVQITAQEGQSTLMLVTLRVAPVIVVHVDGPPSDSRLADFRQRRRLGNGTFFDRAEIERRNPRVLSDLLRTVPGIRLESFQGGLRYVSGRFRSISPSAGTSGNGACDMMIYLNGQPFPSDAGTSDARIRVNEILALEVYVAAGSVPREFAGANAACGVILIWVGT
jgi:hypothetical protein